MVDILNTVDRGTEKHIMETLEIEEPELADEIRKKMFVFEDILLLDDKAIQRVLRDVDNNDLAVALKGINYAKELLEKALGSDKAMDVIGKLTASLQVKPFEFVRKTDASQLINFIQDEHPQTIALILSYLSPSQAALIISALPPDSQAEVARRIAARYDP